MRILGAKPSVGAAIMPALPGERVVLIRHFRHATRSWHWEIPRGFGSSNLSAESTVERELEEELNATVLRLELLGHMSKDSGLGTAADKIYWADLQETSTSPSLEASAEEEGIDEMRIVSHDQFAALIRSGEIADAYALSAYCLAVT